MRHSARNGDGGRILRTLAFALVLAGCAGGPAVFGPEASTSPPSALARFDPTAEGVEIALIEGTSVPMAKLLQRAVVDAFSRYNMPASSAPGSGRYWLSGHAGPNRDTAQPSVIAIEWRVFDRQQGRAAGGFTLPVAADRFAWDNGDPRVIAEVGDTASRRFVAMLQGAAPVAVDHGPRNFPAPLPALAVAAPPGAQAPNTIDPAASLAPGLSSWRPAPPAPAFAKPAEPVLGPAKGLTRGAGEDRPAGRGTPIFLARVGGAPGDGDAALARAAETALALGGFSTASRREDARYVVSGAVNMGAPASGRQPIRVVWEVSALDGRPLGRAVQENTVPAGSLNGTWGPLASMVAGAAVKGIADVIRRTEETAARPAPVEQAERRLKIPSSFTPSLSASAVPAGGGQKTESPPAPYAKEPVGVVASGLLIPPKGGLVNESLASPAARRSLAGVTP